MKNRNKPIKFFFTFALLTLLIKPVYLFDIDSLGSKGDDLSYWIHSATLAFDFDIDYLEDHNYNSGTYNELTNAPSHPPGAGYLASPFVFVFSTLDKLSDDLFDRLNPVGSFAYLGYFFSTQLYTLLGFFMLNKLFLFNKHTKFKLSIFTLTYLSTLVHFSSTRFLMSHSYEFFLVCSLLYLFEKNTEFTSRDFKCALLMFFLLSITRPATFIISLCLILIHKDKIVFRLKNLGNLLTFSIFGLVYVLLSKSIYQTNSILLDLSSNKTTAGYVDLLNIQNLLDGLLKLPNLFFSSSGGLIWSTPIVFLGVICFVLNQVTRRELRYNQLFFSILYILGFFIVAMVWQGREVAYGQRLFIGLLPYASYQVAKFVNNKVHHKIILLFVITSYLHYLFLYSSDILTLRAGYSLWGTYLDFAAEEYTLNLINQLFNIQNYLSIFVKSIYSINFFGVFDFEYFFNLLPSGLKNIEKISLLKLRAQKYFLLNYGYILLATFIHLFFTYCFVKISNRQR